MKKVLKVCFEIVFSEIKPFGAFVNISRTSKHNPRSCTS
jgi:hypothetical protein